MSTKIYDMLFNNIGRFLALALVMIGSMGGVCIKPLPVMANTIAAKVTLGQHAVPVLLESTGSKGSIVCALREEEWKESGKLIVFGPENTEHYSRLKNENYFGNWQEDVRHAT